MADSKKPKSESGADPETTPPYKLDQSWEVSADDKETDDGASETADAKAEAAESSSDALEDTDQTVTQSGADLAEALKDAEPEVAPEPDADPEAAPSDHEPAPEPDMVEARPQAVPQEKVVERVVEKRGGFGAALIGGLVAGVIAFVGARTEVLDPFLPAALKSSDNSAALTAIDAKVTAQSSELAQLTSAVSGLKIPTDADIAAQIKAQTSAAEDQIAALKTQTTDLSKQVAGLSDQLAPLDARLTNLEKRPLNEGVSEAAIAAYEKELAALQAAMATQRSQVEAMIKDAEAVKAEASALEEKAAAAAKVAAERAMASQLQTAVAAGAPFTQELDALKSSGIAVPDALAASAKDGVATMATLRTTFAPAARAALAAVRTAENGDQTSLTTFLKRQLGARSVEPREGDDPDAILSRAEAALTAGDLSKSLSEISALPGPALDAMSDWTGAARTRQQAIDAADALANGLNTN